MALTPGAFGGATVEVRGLRELVRAFQKFDKDLVGDLVMELQEAAESPRKLTEQYILGGGGGFPGMRNVDAYWAGVRVGVSKRMGLVYLAPAWRGRGINPNPLYGHQVLWRMEGAVEDKADEIEKNVGKFLDRLADDWGSQLAA